MERAIVKREHPPSHIVLVLGPHVPGADRAIEHVINAEKAAAVSIENADTAKGQVKVYNALHMDAEELAKETDFMGIGFGAQVFLSARKHEIPFFFGEHHSETQRDIIHRRLAAYSEYRNLAAQRFMEGDIDGAIEAGGRSEKQMRELQRIREPKLAATNLEIARNLNGKPLLVFAGNMHTELIKLFRQGGAKVTIYTVPSATYGKTGTPGTSQRTITKKHKLRQILKHIIIQSIGHSMGLGEEKHPFIDQAITNLSKFETISPEKIEAFSRSLKGSTQQQATVRFVQFLLENKVKLPQDEEVAEAKRRVQYPIPKKVVTLEPIRK